MIEGQIDFVSSVLPNTQTVGKCDPLMTALPGTMLGLRPWPWKVHWLEDSCWRGIGLSSCYSPAIDQYALQSGGKSVY